MSPEQVKRRETSTRAPTCGAPACCSTRCSRGAGLPRAHGVRAPGGRAAASRSPSSRSTRARAVGRLRRAHPPEEPRRALRHGPRDGARLDRHGVPDAASATSMGAPLSRLPEVASVLAPRRCRQPRHPSMRAGEPVLARGWTRRRRRPARAPPERTLASAARRHMSHPPPRGHRHPAATVGGTLPSKDFGMSTRAPRGSRTASVVLLVAWPRRGIPPRLVAQVP